jgi:hypothetical protein
VSTHLSRLSLVALALVALPFAAGCSTPVDDGADSSHQNVSAREANEQRHEMRPLLENVRAGRAAERLGIARWDVFAGTSKNESFEGAVFYASDERGDVKVFFAFDNATRAYAVGQLDPEGRPVTTALDRATVDALFADIEDLRERARRQSTRDCVAGIGIAALSGVLAAGAVAFTGIPAAIGGAAAGLVATSGSTAAHFVAILATYVGVEGGIFAVVGVASSAAVAAVTDVAESCDRSIAGVGGATGAP